MSGDSPTQVAPSSRGVISIGTTPKQRGDASGAIPPTSRDHVKTPNPRQGKEVDRSGAAYKVSRITFLTIKGR